MKSLGKNLRQLSPSVILMFLMLISISEAQIPEDMVLYLPLDEGEGKVAVDLSIHHNNAEIKGNPKWVEGPFGMALQLGGASDHLVVKNSPSLQLTDALTISCWVQVTGAGDLQSGVEKEPGWQVGEYNLMPVYNGLIQLQMFDLPEGCDDEGQTGNIKDSKWHYITGAWDGDVITLYLDGEPIADRDCSGKLAKGSGDLYIGTRGGNDRFLQGMIDEIKIYGRGLSSDEIQADMADPRHNLAVLLGDKLPVLWGKLKGDKPKN
ncbi:LamG domain-containing protein [bacterium]|nr:LamG domain-containing protein [bacterium]